MKLNNKYESDSTIHATYNTILYYIIYILRTSSSKLTFQFFFYSQNLEKGTINVQKKVYEELTEAIRR